MWLKEGSWQERVCCNFTNQLPCQEFFGFEYFELLVAYRKCVQGYTFVILEQGPCPGSSGFDIVFECRNCNFNSFLYVSDSLQHSTSVWSLNLLSLVFNWF